jgi:beta-galactosidase
MCEEDFNGQPCTLLRDAIGIRGIQDDLPFYVSPINAFQYRDVPVSFIQTYSGDFDEVFATRGEGDVVGFIKSLGKGKVMVFGAAMYTETVGDIDIVHQMAMKFDCPPLFKLSDWADVRISIGEKGSFLFVNNYQDDPVETIIEYENEKLFGGSPVCLAARTGLILPVNWQVRDGVMVHYATSEIVEVAEEGDALTLKTQQREFTAEVTLKGYRCEAGESLEKSAQGERLRVQGLRVQGKDGVILLRRE